MNEKVDKDEVISLKNKTKNPDERSMKNHVGWDAVPFQPGPKIHLFGEILRRNKICLITTQSIQLKSIWKAT